MPATKSLRASLIISASDNSDALKLVLDSVLLQKQMPCEVLVADEGVDDQTRRVVEQSLHKLACPIRRIAYTVESKSRAPLLNAAIRETTGDYLMFVDADCVLHRSFVRDHVRNALPGTFVQGRRARVRLRYVRRLRVRSFSALWWFARGRIRGVRSGIRRPWPIIRLNDFRIIHGSNFAAWRQDLVTVNGFDEAFDQRGRELVELAERMRNSGLTLRTVTGQAIVYHLDHYHLARYQTLTTERILERTRRDKIKRCDFGLVHPVTSVRNPPTPVERSVTALVESVSCTHVPEGTASAA